MMQENMSETSKMKNRNLATIIIVTLLLLIGIAVGLFSALLGQRFIAAPPAIPASYEEPVTDDDYYQAAITKFENAIAASPKNQTPYRELMRLYLREGDLNAVNVVWEKAIEENPKVLWPYDQLVQVHQDVLPATRAYPESIAIWEEAARRHPGSSWPHIQIGRIHEDAENFLLAQEAYEKAVQTEPENASVQFTLGLFLQEQKQIELAVNAYQWSVALEPESAYYQLTLGRELLRLGRIEDGLTHLEKSLFLDSTSNGHKTVQGFYKRFLSPEQFTASYERIVAQNSADSIAYDFLIERLLSAGQCDLAIQYTEPDAETVPTVADYLSLAAIYQQCNDLVSEANIYRQILDIAPDNLTAYIKLGQFQFDTENIAEAETLFRQAMTLDVTPSTYNAIKELYITRQERSAALDQLYQLLQQAKPAVLQPYEDLVAEYKAIGNSSREISLMELAAQTMPENSELTFGLAEQRYQQGQLAESLPLYRTAIEQQPDNQAYQMALGRALFMTGEIEAGSEILQMVLQNDPSQATYEFIRDLYYENLSWPEPQPYLEEIALIRWPQVDTAYGALAQWYTNYGYPEAAMAAYEEVIEVVPNNPKHHMALGRLYFSQGNTEAAEPYFIQAVALDESIESFQIVQKFYFNQWGTDEATGRLTTLLEQARPSVKGVYVNHVAESQRLGLNSQTTLIWQLATEVLPNDAELRMHLATTLERQGETGAAIEMYQQATNQDADNVEYRLTLGNSLLMDGQFDEGAEVLKNALLRMPDNDTYQFVRDTYHKYLSLNTATAENITENITDDITGNITADDTTDGWAFQVEIARIRWPIPTQAYRQLADWYLENGQPERAALAYEHMTEFAPNDPDAYIALGQLYFELGEAEISEEYFTDAIARGNDKAIYRAVQRFYLERFSVEESLERMQQYLSEAQPRIKQPYIDLVNQYSRQEMNEQVIPVLQLALNAFNLDIQPQDADLYYLLAEALYEQEEIDAAIGAYRRAASMQPQNQEWQLNYGRALLAGGHFDDGIRILKTTLARVPSQKTYSFIRDNLHELVAWPQSQAMQEETAQIYWVQVKNTTPAGAYKQLAAWYQEQGQIEAAIATYQNATDLLSDDPASYLELGLLQFEAGDIAASQTQFQQAVALDTTPRTYQAIQNLYTSKLAPSRAAFSLLYLLEQAQPKTLHAYQTLIDFYEDIGDTSQKVSILQLAVDAMPDNDQAIASLADTFYEAGKAEEAIPLYRRALTLRPENSIYGLRLGHALLNIDEIDTAIATIEQALRQEPTQQNYEFAREIYQESLPVEQLYTLQKKLALIRWPLPSDAYGNLARWYQDQDRIQEAVSAYEDAIAADDTLASLYVDLGSLHFAQDEQESAERLFTQAVAMDPSPSSARSIWQLYANSLEPNQALASQLDLLAEAKPLHIQPYDDLIGHYQSVGLASPEATILQIAVGVMPEESQTHFKLAESLYRAELYEQALVSYQQAVALQPSDSQYRLALGRGLLATEQVDEGVDILQSTLRQTPTKQIYDWVRDAYQETLAWPASEPYQLRAALVRWPNFRQAYQNLAAWYVEAAQPDAAISTYQQILEIEQENPAAHEQLTTLYLAQGSCDEASHHALQFARVVDDANSYQSLARTYAQCGPQEAVAVSYQRSMARMAEAEIRRKKPRNVVDVAFRRYGSELANGEIAELLNSAFVEVDFEKSAPYRQLGWYWETIEQPANALTLYQKAVEIEPINGDNHFTLGRLYHELGDTEQALPEYQRALTLSGIKTQSAYLRYGKALVETGRYDQGAEMLTKGFNLDANEWALGYVLTQYIENIPPEDSQLYVVDALQLMPLGDSEVYIETFMQPVRAYLEQEYPGTAISLLDMASDMNPKFTWPHVRLFYVYRGLEQPKQAISAIQKAAQADPKDAWVRLTLGNALRRSGDVEQALAELRQAVQLAPEEAWYHIYFGHALFQNDQLGEGQIELQAGLLLAPTEEAYGYVNQLYTDYLTAEQVIPLYEEILAQHPEDLFAKQYLELWQQDEDSEQEDDAVNAESSR